MNTDWTTVVTALVAVYAAGLSTYTLLIQRRESKRHVKVNLAMGFIAHGPQLSEPMFILTASNPGNRPVTLNLPSILLPDRTRLYNPNGDTEVQFPHELAEGKSCKAWFPAKGIAQQLHDQGFTRAVKLVATFDDAVGTQHRSKPIKFTFDKWLQG